MKRRNIVLIIISLILVGIAFYIMNTSTLNISINKKLELFDVLERPQITSTENKTKRYYL